MKLKREILFLLSFLCFVSQLFFVSQAFSQDLKIVTGNKEGTYFKIAEDIQKYAKEFGVNIRIITTDGSLDNINHIYSTKNVHLGIVQADVLYSILDNKKDDPALQEYAKKLRFVFPLHYNEVHILAHQSIKSFEDLKDKKIAVGSRNSGSFLTSAYLFELSGIKPGGQYLIEGKEAIEKLRKKEIDAMIYVAGQPVPLFANDIKKEDNLHFIPVTSEKINSFYDQTVIKSSNYKWMSNDVLTVGIKSLLMTYDFKRENCQHIRKIAKIIQDNIQCLRETGHEKWKSVNLLNFHLKRWPRYECVDGDKLDKEPSYKISNCKTGEKAIIQTNTNINCTSSKNSVAQALCGITHQKEKADP